MQGCSPDVGRDWKETRERDRKDELGSKHSYRPASYGCCERCLDREHRLEEVELRLDPGPSKPMFEKMLVGFFESTPRWGGRVPI
jgi:hypothetical protein